MSAGIALPPSFTGELDRFVKTMPYDPSVFLVNEVLEIDTARCLVRSRVDTLRKDMPMVAAQRGDPAVHPPHVPGPALIQMTGNLGVVHAYFCHGVRFDEGWIGFGSRIHRADFKRLVRLGPPLELESKETRARISPERQIVRYEFRFTQDGKLCYYGDQTASWFKGRAFDEDEAEG